MKTNILISFFLPWKPQPSEGLIYTPSNAPAGKVDTPAGKVDTPALNVYKYGLFHVLLSPRSITVFQDVCFGVLHLELIFVSMVSGGKQRNSGFHGNQTLKYREMWVDFLTKINDINLRYNKMIWVSEFM